MPSAAPDVGGVEHVSVADRDAADLLFGGVAAGLFQGFVDCAPVPCERSGSLRLDDEVLDPESREQDVRVADLVVEVAWRPVQDRREEVLDDGLGRSLGCVSEALLLC